MSCSGYTCLRTAIIFALCYVVDLPYVCVSAHPCGDVCAHVALSQQSTASFANFIKKLLLSSSAPSLSCVRPFCTVCLVLANSLCIDQMGNIAVLEPSSSSPQSLRAHWRRTRPRRSEDREGRGTCTHFVRSSLNSFVVVRR